MDDERDPILQNLFAESQHDLDGEAFTASVMARSRFSRYQRILPWIGGALALAVSLLLLIPLQEFGVLIALFFTDILTITLIDLGEGWLALVLSPVNNIASLIVLGVKALRMGRKKIIGGSYA
jgi:hypothetical protein